MGVKYNVMFIGKRFYRGLELGKIDVWSLRFMNS